MTSLGNPIPGRDENSRWARFERWFTTFFGAYPSRTTLIIGTLLLLLFGLPGGIVGYEFAGRVNAAAACGH